MTTRITRTDLHEARRSLFMLTSLLFLTALARAGDAVRHGEASVGLALAMLVVVVWCVRGVVVTWRLHDVLTAGER